MDIEEFYDQDPRRRASDEIEFGREWSENDRRFEVSWVADTGELYVMAEPYSRHEISTESVTVEVLGVINGRDAINSALAGWREAMAEPNSLGWVRERLAGASGSRCPVAARRRRCPSGRRAAISSGSGRDEPGLVGRDHGLDAVVHADLHEDSFHVRLD